MALIPYITYREPNDEGEMLYYILQKEFPHIKCYISEKPIADFLQPIPIDTYNLFVVFNFTIRGRMIPSYQNIGDEIKSVMIDMAVWFYNNRILLNEKKYKKWKN